MRIKTITLENFRSFKEAIPIEGLSDVNNFIGANNAGKSNILEALRYIQALAQRRSLRNYEEMVFDGDTSKNIHISLSFSLSAIERTEFIKQLFQDNPNLRIHEIIESPFLSALILDVVLGNEGLLREEISISNIVNGTLTILKNSLSNHKWLNELLNLREECKNVRLENINPTHISTSDRSPTPEGWQILIVPGISPEPIEAKLIGKIRELMGNWRWLEPIRQAAPAMELGEQAQLDSKGGGLVKFLFTLQNNNPEERDRIITEFRRILPEIRIVFARMKEGRAILTVNEKNLNSIRDLSNVSSGLTQTLILVAGILNSKPGSLILMEEPELHLHASSQRKLFELIQRESKEKQFLLTTHSTIFTGCDKQKSTYLVTKPSAASIVIKIKGAEELHLIKDSLGHRNTDLFGYECVVFVEGDSEKLAFPIIAEAMGCNFAAKGIRLLNVQGSGKFEKIGQYLRYLKDSGVITYIVADGSERVKEKLTDWQRNGLIAEDHWTVWESEFEDCFSLETIVEAFNIWLKEENAAFEVTVDNLTSERRAGVPIAKTLEKICCEKDLPSLNKPALAEKIANILLVEMAKQEHKSTPPEQAIKKIMQLVRPTED